ncbi:MAG: molybdopterin converting factor small subunit [Verrucomicrobiales bacterium]|jgi:molybdopterin converting factor small subunit
MTLKILFFSTLREITQLDDISMAFESKEPLNVADILERLYIVYPDLREWDDKVLISLDQEYVDRKTTVSEGQELALMPPVQGG